MKRVLGWLQGRALLFALLVAVFAFSAWAWPGLPQIMRLFEQENVSAAEIRTRLESDFAQQQALLARRTAEAKSLPADQIRQRITAREAALAEARERQSAASEGLFAPYRPSRMVARTQADIAIAALERELTVLRAALAPRQTYATAQNYLTANPTMPTQGAIAAAQAQCTAAQAAVTAFDQRWKIDQGLRETFRQERTDLLKASQTACRNAADRVAKRQAALAASGQLRDAAAKLTALQAAALPPSLIADPGRVSLRDILLKALLALIVITLTPAIYRVIAYYALAPLAVRWPPMRFAPEGAFPPQPVATPSAISVPVTLAEGEEALVRQDYLQSSSLKGAKRTRWLLDWHNPLTSLTSGMRFLTAISGAGERVTVSAVKDPFAELAILTVPADAACILRPSALAAVVQPQGQPMTIRSRWRLFSLPAWLTWQWRYLVFHGPVRLVVKGGRGVRIEAADHGRIVGEGQMLGFSTDLAYGVIRSETFWPYFFGREALLKDKVEAGSGVLLIEEAPLAGRSGIRRGLQGAGDALLKVFGV